METTTKNASFLQKFKFVAVVLSNTSGYRLITKNLKMLVY